MRVYDDNKQYFQICYFLKNKFGSYNWRSICTAAQEFVVKKTKTKKTETCSYRLAKFKLFLGGLTGRSPPPLQENCEYQ